MDEHLGELDGLRVELVLLPLAEAGHDAEHVLHGAGEERERMGLELRQVDDDVGVENALRDVERVFPELDSLRARGLEVHELQPRAPRHLLHPRVRPDALDSADRAAGAVSDERNGARAADLLRDRLDEIRMRRDRPFGAFRAARISAGS